MDVKQFNGNEENILIKAVDKEHLASLLDGNLFMLANKVFRENEDKEQGDWTEGLIHKIFKANGDTLEAAYNSTMVDYTQIASFTSIK